MEGFDDFTLASSWERFISEIEAICRLWLADGPKKLMEKGAECTGNCMNLYNIKCELKYGVKLYSMEYYFEIHSNGKSVDWDDGLHNLQLSFGVSDFLVIAPVSASGVVLDAPESCKLLSAVTIALSNCGSKCPAFVPVHDPSRKAYIGIQNMDFISTRRFESDRIGSQVPVRLMHLEGLYELFVSKFALSSIDFSTNCFKVHFTMKLTYRTPPYDDDEDITSTETEVEEMRGDPDKQDHIKIQWDDDCPWTEWYSAEDPVKGFELTAIWSRKTFESSLEMAELENASSVDAEKWFLHPILSSNMIDDSAGKLIGFASQLQLLVRALEMSFEAQFLEDYVSSENPGSANTKPANAIPPPTVTDRVLKEIFHEGKENIIIDNEVEFQAEKNRSVNLLDEGSVCQHGSNSGLDDHHDSQKTVIRPMDPVHVLAPADVQRENKPRRGSAGVVGSVMLLHSFQKMHVPYTQDAPVMTEDMHEERLRAVEAFGNAFGFSGQLERDILSSDMSAFKAANPDAVFEDFIRWHSPGDWEEDETETPSNIEKMQLLTSSWPPIGRLSQRMSEHGNSWRQIWNEAPVLPASEQKPLFDPIREGEKVIHYLETLRPYQLLEQMVCTAFRASADTLSQTTYGDLKLIKTKVDQLYLTLVSTLRPLQANYLLDKADLIGDLKKLCVLFEHIEKLLILAASVHRKLWDAPRLSEAIFNGCFNFYLPKMGTSLTSICYEKEFNIKELVKVQERDAVMSLFPHPTANQSWRKVISMGNLLNGHEPALREIIFSVNDAVSDIGNYHYGSSVPSASAVESETHRMYISGTSNDLQVSLSVTSWD